MINLNFIIYIIVDAWEDIKKSICVLKMGTTSYETSNKFTWGQTYRKKSYF